MERLLAVELESAGCAAEIALNGMPVAALGTGGGRTVLAVHEYTLSGRNALALTVGCAPAGQAVTPQPRVAVGPTWARARLALVRQGQSPGDPNARVLGAVEWAAPEGKTWEAPSTHTREVDLPVTFPRWRWLDAPPIAFGPLVHRQILEFVQELSIELAHGNPEPLLVAAKLRMEELALAYQRNVADVVQRFRDHLQGLYAAKALKVVPPTAEDVVLRPVVEGRLVECLTPVGGPALRTRNEAPALGDHAWPLRLALVEGRIYVLR
jgi:hypothetical protein